MAIDKRAALVCIFSAAVAAAASGAAWAQANSPAARAVAARQAGFKQLGGAFKTINDQLKSDKPDMAAIRTASGRAVQLGQAMNGWFPAGSGAQTGVKTGAKPEVWSDAQGFATARAAFQAETVKLQRVAAGTDIAALKAQVQATGKTCGGCHAKFRVKDD